MTRKYRGGPNPSSSILPTTNTKPKAWKPEKCKILTKSLLMTKAGTGKKIYNYISMVVADVSLMRHTRITKTTSNKTKRGTHMSECLEYGTEIIYPNSCWKIRESYLISLVLIYSGKYD
jgi:hypothetical protein